MNSNRKIVIIGAGHVGTQCAYSLCHIGVCREIVLIDTGLAKAASHALDLADTLAFQPTPALVRTGDYSDCRDADLVAICAGVPRLPGQTRLDTLGASIQVIKEIVEPLAASGFHGVLVTISNPADIVADFMRRHTGFEKNKVFSTGTALDSARLKRILSELTGVHAGSIQALCMGEHGDSQMIPFSTVTVQGQPLEELMEKQPEKYQGITKEEILTRTRMTGMDIINGKNATEFGIGCVFSHIAKTILNDEKRIIPVSPLLEGQYGMSGFHASVPAVLGAGGIEEIIELPLTQEEQAQFAASCGVIQNHIRLAEQI